MAEGRNIEDPCESDVKIASCQINDGYLQALPLANTGKGPSLQVPLCRQIRLDCLFGVQHGAPQCIDCAFLDKRQFGAALETEFLKHCRTIREFVEKTANELFSSHVASILLTPGACVLDCDQRGLSFLKTGGLLSILHNRLRCCDHVQDNKVQEAIKETAESGHATTILLTPLDCPQQRYSLAFIRLDKGTQNLIENVLCLVAPLDRRRFATVRQLMALFNLSAAEACLARALCHGDSLDEYATDQGLKLPTVKTQLRSVFAKTGTERQASLIRLLSGIPVVRDEQTTHRA